MDEVGWGVLQLEALSFTHGKLSSVHGMDPEVCSRQNFPLRTHFCGS